MRMFSLNNHAHLLPELLANLDMLQQHGQQFWQQFSPETFVSKVDRTWSPAENVEHLLKSTRPVARALRMPRWLLRLLFGVAKAPSRRWLPLREAYLHLLATGTEAGSYGPTPRKYEDPSLAQQQLIGKLNDALSQLRSNLESWNDTDLDRYQLPHPSLGKLTVREMVMFTLFHYEHHVEKVRMKTP
jgi:hypothetical protein